jgi:hypothetical protein
MKRKNLLVAASATSLIVAAATGTALLTAGPAFAFHSGGVAECEGCHTMHNSLGGEAMTKDFNGMPQFQAGPYLLQGSDASSACLNCHGHADDAAPASYHIYDNDPTYNAGVTTVGGVGGGNAPANITPGGDFSWLKKTFTWVVRGTTNTSPGERHGHNIVAADYGFDADTTLTVAPGGTYEAGKLHCSSCHDPHGKYRRNADGTITTSGKPIRGSGSYNTSTDPSAAYAVGTYRLLAGEGYTTKAGTPAFTAGPPAAVAPSTYNRTEAVDQTRVAYGSGMSEWCANCHGQLHSENYVSGTSGLKHPAGNAAKLGTAIAANYNSYVKTGDMTGTSANAYNSLVPFEEGTTTYADLKAHALNTDAYLNGPDAANSNVACISCHRVHASGFDSMTRFDAAGYEFMTVDVAGVSSFNNASVLQGKSEADYIAALNGRTADQFAPYQRSLCNKCHAKD